MDKNHSPIKTNKQTTNQNYINYFYFILLHINRSMPHYSAFLSNSEGIIRIGKIEVNSVCALKWAHLLY